MGFYDGKRVLVTGGAGFIGSHLVEELVKKGARVYVADNFSRGSLLNLESVLEKIGIVECDLVNYAWCKEITRDMDVVFHLAAPVGGRGYIEEHPGECCQGLAINENIFRACLENDVERVHFASSACVYPNNLQSEYFSDYLLREEDALLTCPKEMDTIYGWVKLTGELQLKAYYREYGMKSSIARYVTVYGPRENKSHAIIALLLRAIKREDPYLVWGSGDQDRDFTYISDIIEGSLLLTEKVTDATPINLGTGVKYTIETVVEKIFDIVGWRPKTVRYDSSKPEGVKSRGLDISKARALGWEPKVDLDTGLRLTYEYLRERHA
ncbi:MAG: NAD-dependent dehydratase [Candidatus Thorarchaeota archaeon]|nr:MAG: NAD-dependent dehydratase [Candidatus Thorarchaeota archaeon]